MLIKLKSKEIDKIKQQLNSVFSNEEKNEKLHMDLGLVELQMLFDAEFRSQYHFYYDCYTCSGSVVKQNNEDNNNYCFSNFKFEYDKHINDITIHEVSYKKNLVESLKLEMTFNTLGRTDILNTRSYYLLSAVFSFFNKRRTHFLFVDEKGNVENLNNDPHQDNVQINHYKKIFNYILNHYSYESEEHFIKRILNKKCFDVSKESLELYNLERDVSLKKEEVEQCASSLIAEFKDFKLCTYDKDKKQNRKIK